MTRNREMVRFAVALTIVAVAGWMSVHSNGVQAHPTPDKKHQHEKEKAAEPAVDLSSPVGTWRTISDKDDMQRSLVQIWEHDGKLFGKIIKIYPRPTDPKELKCDLCEGSLKNAPTIGLRILWDLRKDDDQWVDGLILDPENGKTYKCFIELQDGGKKLKVRGFLGVSLIGRTQYWHRVK